MALERQNIQVNFSKGVDTKSDPKQVVPGKFLELNNCVFQSIGQVKKRNGYQALATNASLTAGNLLASYKNELVAGDGSNLYSYTAVNSNEVNKGTKVAVDLEVNPIVRSSSSQTNSDSATLSNLQVYVWIDSSGGARYSVLDLSTDAYLVNNALVFLTASSVKVRTVGTNFVIFFMDGVPLSGPPLKYVSISTTTPTVLSSPVSIDTGTNGHFDAQLINAKIFIVYGGGGNVRIKSLDSTLTLSAATTVAEAAITLTVFGDTSNNVWVAYPTGAQVKYFIRSFTLTAVLAPTVLETIATITNITGIFSGGLGNFFYEKSATEPYNYLVRKTTGSLVGVIGTPSDLLRSVGLITKPFVFNSVIYLGVLHESVLQSTSFVVNSLGTVICKIAPGLSGPITLNVPLSEITILSSTEFQFPYILKDSLGSVNGEVFSQTGVSNSVLTFGDPIKNDYLANNLHLSGGIVSMYDGAKVVEHGFNLFPENLSGQTRVFAGGLSNGHYDYEATYEWMDNQGQTHRSAPSPVLTEDFSTSTFNLSGDTTNASTLITNASDLTHVAIGMTITGTGIPASTTVTSITGTTQFTISNPATATASDVTLTVTNTYNFQAETVAGSTTILTESISNPIFTADTVSGSNVIKVWNPGQLKVGYTVSDSGMGLGAIPPSDITAINGNSFTLTNNATATRTGTSFFVYIDTGPVATVVIATPTISNLSAGTVAILFVGQVIQTNAFFAAGSKIISIGPTSVTLDNNSSASATLVDFTFEVPETVEMYVGQTITSADLSPPTIPVSTVIDSFTGNNGIVLNNAATKNNTSITLSITMTNSVRIVVPTLRITEKTGNNLVYIVLYRTLSNGTVLFRTSSLTSLTFNDTTVDSVVFYDNNPDSEIIGNNQLYTTGGELENIAAPAVYTMTPYKSRLFAVTEEDPLLLWYSKQVISGSPVEFSDAFTLRVNEKDGGITAISQMDDKLIIFKHSTIYYMVGDGPAPNGASNDFTDPLLINSDTGCINKKSVVIVPSGIMFQSTKGIYLIDRSLQVHYIGADAEEFNEDTVTSARLIETFNQVRFSLNTGEILVYDYFFEQWSTFTNINAIDSCVFQNLYTYLTPTGDIFQETPGIYLDDTVPVLINFLTGFFSFAGLQGFERVYKLMFLGNWFSPHTLTIGLGYDFVNSFTQNTVIASTTAPTGAYQFRVFFDRQKCETFQIQFQESQDSPFGEGLDISSLAFEVGVKKGLNKLAAVNSYGG